MNYIPGSQEFLARHHYRVERIGPAVYAVLDDEDDGKEVCRATTHADAVRALLSMRFDG